MPALAAVRAIARMARANKFSHLVFLYSYV